MNVELTDQVKEKLGDAVELWAVDVLPGKPAILATAVFFALESTLKSEQEKIMEKFPD